MKSLILALSAIGSVASAAQVGSQTVNSCEILTPFKFTQSETAELARHGYSVKVKRSSFHNDRFLNVYEYYEMKERGAQPGDLFVQTVLVPNSRRVNAEGGAFEQQQLSKRELSFRVKTTTGESTFAFATSTPPFARPTDEEFNNAQIGSIPDCR